MSPIQSVSVGTFFTMIFLGIVSLIMWGYPQYKVWQQGLAGQAELARAEQNKMIKVQEAKAKLESAEYLNQAEVKRAEGVAKANKIIGESLSGNQEYLQYLWIQGMTDEGGKPSIIYVPTEASLPILEAGKR
ncbi:MAG: hypothetical protein R3B95_11785 [Nitrospirales bacterium]|nr:hypothetical protein [Nitrospirales bacterium]